MLSFICIQTYISEVTEHIERSEQQRREEVAIASCLPPTHTHTPHSLTPTQELSREREVHKVVARGRQDARDAMDKIRRMLL